MASRGRITIEIDKTTKSQLQAGLKDKLSKISSYTDDVLPEYVLVMVGNGKTEAQVSEDLEAFLGKDNAKEFARWLWETLMSPNFGLGNAQKQEKEHEEEEPPRKLSSQVVPIHRDDDIVGNILGDDRDDYNETNEREGEKERPRERERDTRDRERERTRERVSDRDRVRERSRERGRERESDRRPSMGDDRHRYERERERERERDRRDPRDLRERERRGREGDRDRDRDWSLNSFIGRVRSDGERPRDREPHPERVREERTQRLRTSSSALPARLIMSAVEQAAASTKRRGSQTQLRSDQDIISEPEELVEQIDQGFDHEPIVAVNRKRKPAPEDGEATIAANRPVSFTITLDGAAKLSPASSGVPAQKRTRRVIEAQLGGGIGATVSNDDDEEEDSALVLTAGDIDGVPSFEDADSAQGEGKSKRKRCTFWPQCANGAQCPFYHPTENCKSFPNCSYGKKCLYIHPSLPCKFGVGCTRPNCNFSHPPPMFAAAAAMGGFGMAMAPVKRPRVKSIPCRNGFVCTVSACKYSHPTGPCKFGRACTRGALCSYAHAPPCRFGSKCTRIGCTFAHMAKNATWTAAQARDEAPIPPVGDRPRRQAPATSVDNDAAAPATAADADSGPEPVPTSSTGSEE